MQSNYRPIGEYIKLLNHRNTAQKTSQLLGINIDKFFMPSVANVVGTDLARYKVVEKNQFACNRMHVGRDYRIPIALSDRDESFIVSPAYDVFEIKDTNILMPEYLMMWFSRPEFDRNAWFFTDADVRGGLSWDAFCKMKLPVPSIETQRAIVTEYNTVKNRITLNNQLIQKLEETAQAIYKQWFVDFEFSFDFAQGKPDEKGKPYKSSGGKMVFNEELEKEIPEGWKSGTLGEIMKYSKERIKLKELKLSSYISTENMIENRGGVIEANSLPSAESVPKFNESTILISNIRPYFKKIWLAEFKGGCSNDILCIEAKNVNPLFLYFILEQDIFFDYVMAGSKGTKMPRGDKEWILQYPIVIPKENQLNAFSKIVNELKTGISIRKLTIKCLIQFNQVLNSKMATIEN
jgi:type I restriction enzyme S subunit